MDIYFNKGASNEEVVLESDILKMSKPEIKNLKQRCQNAINEVSLKRNIFRTENELNNNSQEYWRKMYVYKCVINKYIKAVNWLCQIESNATPPQQQVDREHWFWCYYQESMKVLTEEMVEQIKEMADNRAKFHLEEKEWEYKE